VAGVLATAGGILFYGDPSGDFVRLTSGMEDLVALHDQRNQQGISHDLYGGREAVLRLLSPEYLVLWVA